MTEIHKVYHLSGSFSFKNSREAVEVANSPATASLVLADTQLVDLAS
jgi:hypothetical protein